MRKLGVLASFAAGTALALAPLAAAEGDTTGSDFSVVLNAAFGTVLYGINWENEISSDPGADNLLNGALTQFIDANNVLLFAILNGGDQIDFENAADYLFGTDAAIIAGLAGDSAWEDAALFLQAGMADIGGYLAIDL